MTQDINPIEETRHIREQLLEKHGSIANLHRHMDAERQKLENQGWQFVTAEEVLAKKYAGHEKRA